VPLPDAFLNSTELKKAREMTWPQLQQRRAEILADLADVAAKTAVATSQMLVAGAPADLPRHLDNLKQKRFYTNRELLSIEVEMQMRPSIAVGCLCFVLVGCPVGIWFSRSDHLSAFVTCFLPIVFIYYPLMLCGINIARNGRFNVAPCVWGSDCLMALASLFLIRRLMRN
jgi:lipopolysaccharide export system permease protein